MESHKIIQVEEKSTIENYCCHLVSSICFAMFGASVLVPFIFGINPAIVLFYERCGKR